MNLLSLIEEKVLYVPVELTSLQKELYRVLIRLHRDSLCGQLQLVSSANDSDTEIPSETDAESNQVLVKHLKLVNNHPFLLVEHYIPKKLLLMESNERLMLQSDKFNKLDKIIQTLLKRDLNLLLVGSSVKELDLIEAFLLERDLVCTRSIKGIINHSHKKKKKTTTRLKVSLITSNKLLGLNFPDNAFDLIISLDENLDENDQVLETLRKFNRTPLIKLILINSFKHGAIANHEKDKDFLFSCLGPLLSTQEEEEEEEEENKKFDIESILTEFLKTKQWGFRLPTFQTANRDEITALIQSIDLQFQEETQESEANNNNNNNTKKKIKLESENLSPSNYQKLLTKLTIHRLESIEAKISSNSTELAALKIKANNQNNDEDELKLKISDLFKQSKELKDTTLFNVAKVFDRLTLEKDKYNEIVKDLEPAPAPAPDPSSDSVMESEQDLTQKLESLRLENSSAESTLDALRLTYQQHTTEAGELSNLLKSLESRNSGLLSTLEDKGLRVRSLKNETIRVSKEDEMSKLKLELQFLNLYQERLDALVKERVHTLNVGRNGRVHRSTTPYT
jgi:hypothetical protein